MTVYDPDSEVKFKGANRRGATCVNWPLRSSIGSLGSGQQQLSDAPEAATRCAARDVGTGDA